MNTDFYYIYVIDSFDLGWNVQNILNNINQIVWNSTVLNDYKYVKHI